MAAPFATHPERNFSPARADLQPAEWEGRERAGSLAGATCHVWKVAVEFPPAGAPRLVLLDGAERERVAGFARTADANRFAATRSALRSILAGYLNCAPQKIVFQTGRHGRPRLAGREVDFNVAHSGKLALIAVCGRPGIGIDIEAVREVKDVLTLSQRHFQPEEMHEMESVAAPERSRVFLSCWTRKEAVMKSTGLGLAMGPSRINAGCGPDPRWLDVPAPCTPGWLRVASILPGDGYVGACAVPGHIERLEFMRYDPGPCHD